MLTSYALLPRDRRLLSSLEWRMFALDEAQAVKNPLTRAAQTARAITAGHRVALTGTPVENRLDDLWSIMHILNPGLLGTRTGFRRLFANAIERHGDGRAEDALRRMTGPFLLRRRKTDPAVLPDLPAAPGLDRVLHAHRRAGRALPGHDRRDARARPRPLAGSSGAATCSR